ncbi:MAG TPA: TonB-dependent receptor [Pseudomonadales bacterium]
MRLSVISCCAVIGCGCVPALAQDDAAGRLEEVVVTANRVERPISTIPNTVTVIDQVELEQQLAVNRDLSTVLGNLVPSFSPSRQKLTNAGETLRGRKPLYMIDGVPQSNPLRSGGRDGHTIDPAILERIEVLHGANAIHGLGASGGIINLITKKPAARLEQHLRIDTNGQSEDLGESADYGLTYSLSNRFGNADVLASLSYRESGIAYDADGDVIGVDNTQGDTMDSTSIDGFIKAGVEWADQRLELTANHFDLESNNDWISVPGDVAAGVPTSARKGDIEGEGARNEVTTLSLTYTHAAFYGHDLRVQVFSQDFSATYGAEVEPIDTFQDPAFGPDLIDQSQNNSEKIGAKITLAKERLFGWPVNLVYGLDALRDETWQALIQTGREWVPKSRYENIAPYLQLDYEALERLNLTAGVRHERSRLEVDDFTTLAFYGSQFVRGGKPDFSETLYNVGAVYQFSDTWRVFGNYAEAFSMPDVGRVLRGIDVPGQSVETFLDLKPILTESTEVGAEFDNGRFNAQLSYYRSNSDFGQRLQRGADGIYTVEREKTKVDGIELRALWMITGADTLGARYAQMDGRYDSDGDGHVDTDLDGSNIGPDRINLSWDRQWTEHLSTRLQVNHLRDRTFDAVAGSASAEFDEYTTVDLMADLAALGGTFLLGVQNLTNEDYFTYYSQTNLQDHRYFKGIGRSFSLSYQRTF